MDLSVMTKYKMSRKSRKETQRYEDVDSVYKAGRWMEVFERLEVIDRNTLITERWLQSYVTITWLLARLPRNCNDGVISSH